MIAQTFAKTIKARFEASFSRSDHTSGAASPPGRVAGSVTGPGPLPGALRDSSSNAAQPRRLASGSSPRFSWARAALVVAVAATAAQSIAAQQPVTPVPDSAHAPEAARDPHAALPERPTVATHAYTVAPRYVELEVGGQLAQPQGGSAFQLPALVKIGVTPRLQLDVSSGFQRTRAVDTVSSGASDLAIGLKWHLPTDGSALGDLALQGTLKLPSAPARTVGTGTTDFSLLAISSHQWSAVELDLNVGITSRTGDGSRAPTLATVWTASLGAPISGHLAYAAELFGYPGTSGAAGAPPAVGFLIGPTYAVRPWLVLDAGGIFNVSHLGVNSGYAGLTWNIGRF